MADKTKIEWTDATWNPITGCSVVSPGCTNCYAMRLAGTRLRDHPSRAGLTIDSKAGPVWNGEVRLNKEWLDQPLRWKKPRMIFVCAHGDLFHENVPDEWIDQVFAVMALAPQHTFQVLTKRPERMRDYLAGIREPDGRFHKGFRDVMVEGMAQKIHHDRTGEDPSMWLAVHLPLPNVWLGVSVEDQKRADERIPLLMETPAALRWLSAEPLLGPVDLEVAWNGESSLEADCWGDCGWCRSGHPPLHNCTRNPPEDSRGRSGVDWVVVGGESGPGARPMHPDWARQIRDACMVACVPFHFKQWGAWAPDECLSSEQLEHHELLGQYERLGDVDMVRVGKKAAGRHLDGVIHDGFPEGVQ